MAVNPDAEDRAQEELAKRRVERTAGNPRPRERERITMMCLRCFGKDGEPGVTMARQGEGWVHVECPGTPAGPIRSARKKHYEESLEKKRAEQERAEAREKILEKRRAANSPFPPNPEEGKP